MSSCIAFDMLESKHVIDIHYNMLTSFHVTEIKVQVLLHFEDIDQETLITWLLRVPVCFEKLNTLTLIKCTFNKCTKKHETF